MIRIDRSRERPPADLEERGSEDLERIATLVEAGTLTSDDFRKDLYGSEDVKRALWRIQHLKCCYCELKNNWRWSTVEHFRPKTRARRLDGTVERGYWWLAYELRNLYFACNNCNTPKGDRFPLEPGTTPLEPKQLPWTHEERPLLLDPGRDEPEAHLKFVRVRGWDFRIAPRNGSTRGEATIKAIDLRRDELLDRRRDYIREHLKPVVRRFLKARRRGDEEAAEDARQDASRLTKASSRFSLLAWSFFRELGLL